ncbi:hypothetical protein HKX48_006382 [Thoreauomyces humboldtii]|nr:hypothetical protein HKX48_006382 [Thoreauomyces humboldtii]
MKSELFHSTFTVTELDPYGKRFDRVSRITALSETNDIEITLDVNTEIYPLGVQDKLVFSLASTLALDGNAASADTLSRDA